MDGVGTSIVGRPRRLSADRRTRPTYTFIWEEPVYRPCECGSLLSYKFCCRDVDRYYRPVLNF